MKFLEITLPVLAVAGYSFAQSTSRAARDPALVGYIATGSSYSGVRTCDYPQTVSTSGSYVQCCPTTGSCPFYTACSSNVLLGPSGTVACYVSTALTCNTAIVQPTAGAAGGGSYLACWQSTLGSGPITFVQDIGAATAAGSTSAAASSNTARTGSSASATATSASGSSSSRAASSSAAAASSTAGAAHAESGLTGGALGGLMALVMQALL